MSQESKVFKKRVSMILNSNVTLNFTGWSPYCKFIRIVFQAKKNFVLKEEKAADGAKAEETRSIKDRLGPPVIPDRAKLSLDNTKPKEEAEPAKEKPIIPPASKLSLNNLVTTKAQENVAPKEKVG